MADFHHILPSNTSPDYFPNNNASQYSTPVDNPYVLNGDWEVGLLDASYSSCINAFNNDKITIKEKQTVKQVLEQKDCPPLKVFCPVFPKTYTPTMARNSYVPFINKTFESFLSLKVDAKRAQWSLLTDDYFFILSEPVERLFQLWSDVLTKQDANFKNQHDFHNATCPVPTVADLTFIIMVPKQKRTSIHRMDFTIKDAKEKLTPEEIMKRFKMYIPQWIATLTVQNKSQFRLTKTNNDHHMIIMNQYFRYAMTFARDGMFSKGFQQVMKARLYAQSQPWTISVYTLNKIKTYETEKERDVILPPCSFKREQDATRFVNEKVNDNRITFTCNTNKRINLYISSAVLTVTFDDTLRDIFAFDKNTYSGKKTYTASGVFSLCRRIQYLYIYTNLTDFIRVGNTESPLLAIIPLLHTNDCSLLKERIFRTPMYIKVSRDRISQIDIAIYDGAGQLIPFVPDAVTTLHLHFRQS